MIDLTPVDRLSITTLVDNVVDGLLPDQGPAKRAVVKPTTPAGVLEAGETTDPLRAEHGLSLLISITANGTQHQVLFDAGRSPDGVVQNMRRLDLTPNEVDMVVLSHGHHDHTTGLSGFIEAVAPTNLPLLIHPQFWAKRRFAIPGRDPVELPSMSRKALERAGFKISEDSSPRVLVDGTLLVTGEVERTTSFERGLPFHEEFTDGRWQPDPLVLDDQALVLMVPEKGLVVITGCGHAGIVNIIRYAQKLTGEQRVHAVIGGFHLSGPEFESVIPDVCDSLTSIAPDVVVPAHCTGHVGNHAMADAFPKAFIQNSVGTRLDLYTPDEEDHD